MLIQDLTDKAMDVMKSLDYTQLTIDSIYSASFKPIIDYYLTKGIDSYDPDLNCQIESMYLEQFHNGTVSRHTYYKRLRGIRILKEVYKTGNYIWEKYTDKILKPEEEFFSNHFRTSFKKKYMSKESKTWKNIFKWILKVLF